MAAYIIAHLDYQDDSQLEAYRELAPPTLAAFGIRLLASSRDATPLEGASPGRVTAILEADSVEVAERWFRSPEYQRAAELRRPVSTVLLTVVPGA